MDFKPKLMVFDLDGTLAESKQRVSADMGNLLSQLLQKMPVAVMSGAGLPQMEIQFLPALPTEAKLEHLYLFPTNAASCFVFNQGSWRPQYDHSFSKQERDDIHAALEACLKEIGLDQEPAEVWGDRVQDRGAQITFSAVGQKAPVAAKQAWAAQFNDKRKELRTLLQARLPDFSVSTGGMTSVDITTKDVNKAYGITRLAELSKIAIADMLYVGDALDEGGNDSVVIATGVRTHAVFGPQETASLIEILLKQ